MFQAQFFNNGFKFQCKASNFEVGNLTDYIDPSAQLILILLGEMQSQPWWNLELKL